MRTPLVVTVQDSFDRLTPEEWDHLVDLCPSATVFQRQSWLQAWLVTVAPPAARVVLVTARKHGRLVGAAPLFIEATLRFIGHEHSDYNLFLGDPAVPEVYDALLDEAERLVPARGQAALQEIPESSDFGRALLRRLDQGSRPMRLTHRTACPFLALPTTGEVAISPSLRRHAARLPKAGRVEVRHEQDAGTILELLPAFFDQHVRRWEGTPFPSLFRREANRRFYEALTRRLAPSGAVLFTTVRLEGQLCACHFGFISGRDLLWYKPSFDISLARLSPGQHMLRELLLYASASGLERLDFTRGDEAFKSRLAPERRYNASIVMLPRARDRLLFDTQALARRMRDRLRSALGSDS